jgi:Outer membrane efflux protein
MRVSFCMLALALLGGDEPKPIQPRSPSNPFVITIEVAGPSVQTQVPGKASATTGTTSKAAAAASAPAKASEPQETWPLSLSDAIRIAIDNSEIARVIAWGHAEKPMEGFLPTPAWAENASIVIQRTNADAAKYRFKSEVMAHVRTVEQMYWRLAQTQVALAAANRAIKMATQAVKEEEESVALNLHSRGDDLADAKARLDRFQLELVTRSSDVMTAERQFRQILELPPANKRPIIPTTPPAVQRIEFDWKTCLAEMMREQPDVIQQKLLTRLAEMRLLDARHLIRGQPNPSTVYQFNGVAGLLEGPEEALMETLERTLGLRDSNPFAGPQPAVKAAIAEPEVVDGLVSSSAMATKTPLANTRQAQYALLRSRAYLKQVVHQTTHSLARFFLEVDANYKQYAVARELRSASEKRLEAQRAPFEHGKITVDRYFDAISQYVTAVADEHQYLASYNASLAALSEAKGTLLADRNIIVAERAPSKSGVHLAAGKTDKTVTTTAGTIPHGMGTVGPVLPPLPFGSITVARPELDATKIAGAAATKQPIVPVVPNSAAEKEKPLTWTISIKVGESAAIELKGTIGTDSSKATASRAE